MMRASAGAANVQTETPTPIAAWQFTARVVACAIIAGFVFATFFSTRKPDAQDQDFGAYYRAGQAALAGRAIYAIDSHGPLGAYMYAPVFAEVVFRQLARLPYLWAVRVFLLVNWIAAALCVRVCLQLVRPDGRGWFWTGVIALLCTGDYLKANLHNGQVGLLLLLACLYGMRWIFNGRPIIGGMLLSLAIALKIYPVLLLPYLLLRSPMQLSPLDAVAFDSRTQRAHRWPGGYAVLGAAVGLVVLFILPGFHVGFGHLLELHGQWLRFCLATQSVDQTVRTGNQSLLGVLARLPWICNGTQSQVSTAHLTLLLKLYPPLVLGLTAVLYLLVYLRRTASVLTDLSLLLLWMTVASPRAWTFNFAAEFLPAVVLSTQVLRQPRKCWVAITALLLAFAALTFPTNLFHFPARWTLWAYMLQNKHFDAAVVMGIAVVL